MGGERLRKGLARKRGEQGVDFGGLVLGAHILERLRRFSPCQTGIRGVTECPRRLAKLPQHLGLKQTVLETLCFEDPDTERRNALVERTPFTLDSRPALQRFSDRKMIAARLRTFERRYAGLLRFIELTGCHPDLGQVENKNALDK